MIFSLSRQRTIHTDTHAMYSMVKANCAVKLAFGASWVGSIALALLALVPWFLAFPARLP